MMIPLKKEVKNEVSSKDQAIIIINITTTANKKDRKNESRNQSVNHAYLQMSHQHWVLQSNEQLMGQRPFFPTLSIRHQRTPYSPLQFPFNEFPFLSLPLAQIRCRDYELSQCSQPCLAKKRLIRPLQK